MLRRERKSVKWLAICLSAGLFLTGCSAEVSNVSHAQGTKWTGQVKSKEDSYSLIGTYDSADTAVVNEVDEESNQITLTNLYNGRDYVLHYSRTSYVMDKYGSAMTAGQLKQGQIVDVTFLKSNRQINTLQVSADAWKYDEVERYDLTGVNGTATIGSSVYSLGADARVFSNGHPSDLMDIVKGDVLTISGIGYDIYSICIEKGHGYVRLKNDHNLVGGWIEIGNKVITKVSSENMLLVVPEGSYTVKMYNDVSSVNKEIKVERNQELVLDCSEVKANEDMKGFVRLRVTPEDAEVRIDSHVVGVASPVELTYGIHQIEVSASGYQTLSKYISVGAGYAEISIALEKSPEDEDDDKEAETTPVPEPEPSTEPTPDQNESTDKRDPFASDEVGLPSTVSGNDPSDKKDDVVTAKKKKTNKVYIDSPENVEVFVDGIYKGLAPMKFKKVTGSHTVVLRKNGYVTKSYTIYLYNDGQDITYSFSELEPEGSSEKGEDRPITEKDTSDDKGTSSSVDPMPSEEDKTPTETEGEKKSVEAEGEKKSAEAEEEKKPAEEQTSSSTPESEPSTDNTVGISAETTVNPENSP